MAPHPPCPSLFTLPQCVLCVWAQLSVLRCYCMLLHGLSETDALNCHKIHLIQSPLDGLREKKWDREGSIHKNKNMNLLYWQFLPIYSPGHSQVQFATRSVQIPPFLQGLLSHSLTSAEKRKTESFILGLKAITGTSLIQMHWQMHLLGLYCLLFDIWFSPHS